MIKCINCNKDLESLLFNKLELSNLPLEINLRLTLKNCDGINIKHYLYVSYADDSSTIIYLD